MSAPTDPGPAPYPRSAVVTGANGQVGSLAVAALARRDVAVTALVRGSRPADDRTTIGNWLDSEAARAAIREAESVVHLAGALNPPDHDYERANVLPAERLASALDAARARRIVFLSYVGASEDSRNAYLATKARAERVLRETRVPLTVFRCTHIVGPRDSPGPTAGAMLLHGKKYVTVLGSGRQLVAPLFVGDVVAAILGALASDHGGSFDLCGPDEMTVDELVRLLNRSGAVPIRHVPGPLARLLRLVGPKLPAALIDVMLADSRSDSLTASEAFGLSLTPLRSVWGAPG